MTAIAALRKDPALAQQRYDCIRLPDGRVGNFVWKREIRDDIKDTQPHGSVDMQKGIIVSCNAYFAQLGAHSVGVEQCCTTPRVSWASRLRSRTRPKGCNARLPQASYGQGQVVASPFQMARVAATIANGGNAPEGRWIVDETNVRVHPPEPLLPPISRGPNRWIYARCRDFGNRTRAECVTDTDCRENWDCRAGQSALARLVHRICPVRGRAAKQIAFAVLVENGQYGGTAAAPIAGEIVAAARQLGII